MNSPLADPLVRACFEHHREYAPPELLGRLLPVDTRPAKPADPKPAAVVVFPAPMKRDFTPTDRRRSRGGLSAYPSIGLIVSVVAKFYGVRAFDIISQRRTQDIVLPRHICMYLAHEVTPRSLPMIGRQIGHRDHTTVLFAVRKIRALIEENERLRDEVQVIEMQIAQIMLEAA